MDIHILRDGEHCVLLLNGCQQIPVKDYKISSSMNGTTELEIKIEIEKGIMEFATSTNPK